MLLAPPYAAFILAVPSKREDLQGGVDATAPAPVVRASISDSPTGACGDVAHVGLGTGHKSGMVFGPVAAVASSSKGSTPGMELLFFQLRP